VVLIAEITVAIKLRHYRFFTGLFRISAPEIHRLLHRVIHRFSTSSPPIVDRLVFRQIAGRAALCRGAPKGGAAGGIRMMCLPPEGHEMPDDSAEASVVAAARVRRRGI
jgi:hypothetical protein